MNYSMEASKAVSKVKIGSSDDRIFLQLSTNEIVVILFREKRYDIPKWLKSMKLLWFYQEYTEDKRNQMTLFTTYTTFEGHHEYWDITEAMNLGVVTDVYKLELIKTFYSDQIVKYVLDTSGLTYLAIDQTEPSIHVITIRDALLDVYRSSYTSYELHTLVGNNSCEIMHVKRADNDDKQYILVCRTGTRSTNCIPVSMVEPATGMRFGNSN